MVRKETRVFYVTIRMFYRFNWRLLSEDILNIVELAGGVGTLPCVSVYHERA